MKKFAVLLLFTLLAACQNPPSSAAPSATPVAAATATATPPSTSTPAPTATATPVPFTLEALVWEQTPRVPVLLWHQFAADRAKRSTYMKTRFSDFADQLAALDQAGFSLVSLEDWLNGDLRVPPGRKPLVITLDDLFFNNQIRLDENGAPRRDTGLGIAWYFAQEHPEFGFHYSLFANLGDKYYGAGDPAGEWQDELAQTIAWCQENGAPVYNHTYMHVVLSEMDGPEIRWQLEMNDLYLRQLLQRAGREDLIPTLGNMFAVPFGKWPSAGGVNVIKAYTTPEGQPMQAIFDVDFVIRARYMTSPYHEDFDPYRIPRINADPDAIDYLTANAADFPAPTTCSLRLEAASSDQAAPLAEAVTQAVTSGQCPAGLYLVNGFTFDARQLPVQVLRQP